jgi:hypothetical protein
MIGHAERTAKHWALRAVNARTKRQHLGTWSISIWNTYCRGFLTLKAAPKAVQ